MWSFSRIQEELDKYATGSGDEKVYKQEAVTILLNLLPRLIPVDEEFYLRTYGDVRQAVENEDLKSGAQHFIEVGFFENRLPMEMHVDADDYLTRYPDVARSIAQGEFVGDATEHWLYCGRYEGRTAVLQTNAIGEAKANGDANGRGLPQSVGEEPKHPVRAAAGS